MLVFLPNTPGNSFDFLYDFDPINMSKTHQKYIFTKETGN